MVRASALLLAAAALAGCNGERSGLNIGTPVREGAPARPSPPPVNMAGRWMLSSPGRGQCNMTFGASAPNTTEGTIAPEGGCPGQFYTSRKWTFDSAGLVIRDHNGQPLGQLATGEGGRFDGQASGGDAVTLMR